MVSVYSWIWTSLALRGLTSHSAKLCGSFSSVLSHSFLQIVVKSMPPFTIDIIPPFHPSNISYSMIRMLMTINGTLASVRTLDMRVNILPRIESGSCRGAPNPTFSCAMAARPIPILARNLSSLRIAIAFVRRTQIYISFPKPKRKSILLRLVVNVLEKGE